MQLKYRKLFISLDKIVRNLLRTNVRNKSGRHSWAAPNVVHPSQGDKVGRMIVSWVNVYFWQIFSKIVVQSKMGYLKKYLLIWTKIDWARFWAIFSQNHLVTLIQANQVNRIGRL
jgi:hypothetical protein